MRKAEQLHQEEEDTFRAFLTEAEARYSAMATELSETRRALNDERQRSASVFGRKGKGWKSRFR